MQNSMCRAKSASRLLAEALRAGREGHEVGATHRSLGTQARRRKPPERSPLESFQMDPRQVQHMTPHVLSAAVASAGSNRHRGETLWRAYSDRVLGVQDRLTLHDLRVMLKGYADASVRDSALFRKLMTTRKWHTDKQATPRDLASVAVNLAKLGFVDRETFSEIGSAVVAHLEDMEAMDLASLANAFSRAGCCQHELMDALKAEFLARAKTRPAELKPAVMTLALNAFAVCGHHEHALWKQLLEDIVLKQLPDYTLTQAALVANAIGRCGEAVPEARSTLDAFAKHWVEAGTLDAQFEASQVGVRAAWQSPEDLAYLANTYARLRLSSNAELNESVAAASMRQLSQFTAWQLALLCGALVHLPSAGQKTCIAVIAQDVFPDVLKDCSLGHVALLTSAFGFARASLTLPVAASLTKHICNLVASARAALAQPNRGGDHRSLTSGSLGSLLDGMVHLLSPNQSLQVLAALRPLTLDLIEKGNLRPSAMYSVFSAHAHLGLRDAELFEALAPVGVAALEGEAESSLRSERLLTALGMLGSAPRDLIQHLDRSVGSMAEKMALSEATQALLAASCLNFQDVSASTLAALIQAASEAVSMTPPSMQTSSFSRDLSRLQTAAETMRLSDRTDVASLAESCEGVVKHLAEGSEHPPFQVEPLPPPGLLRSVFKTLHHWAETNSEHLPWQISVGSSSSPAHAGGFQADILLSRDAEAKVAIEVVGPRRCYHGTRELIAICQLKQGLLAQSHHVVQINYWDWPEEANDQLKFLHAKLSIVLPTSN